MPTKETPVSVVIRRKRQVTIPRSISDKLGVKPGDVLEFRVEDSTLIATPKKAIALDALREIQEAFARSGITETELQEAGRRARRKIIKELYVSPK